MTAALGVSAAATALALACSSSEDKPGNGSSSSGASSQSRGTQAAAATDTPKRGGFVRLPGLDPTGWDYMTTNAAQTMNALSFVSDQLLRYKAGPGIEPGDDSLVPSLAKSWEVTDPTNIIFHLDPRARWQDKAPVNGRAVVADDVKYLFDVGKDSLNKTQIAFVKSYGAPDPQTFKVTLTEPDATFLANMGGRYWYFLPKETRERFGDWKTAESIIGTGPFMLDRAQSGARYVFKRNPTYFLNDGQTPYIDQVDLVVFADPASVIAAYQNGDLTLLWSSLGGSQGAVSRDQVPELAKQSRATVDEYAGTSGDCIQMFQKAAPFNDVRVRRAISLGINVEAWVKGLYQGKGQRDFLVPYPMAKWRLAENNVGPAAQWRKYDPTQAKQLLTAAGYPDGLEMKFFVTQRYGAAYLEHANLIVSDLAKIGIRVGLENMDYNAFLPKYVQSRGKDAKPGEVSMNSRSAFDDPQAYTFQQIHRDGTTNGMGVDDAEVNALCEKQRTIMDFAERKKVIDQLQQVHQDRCLQIYTPTVMSYDIVRPELKNYRARLGYNLGVGFVNSWLAS